jgi:serine/threonine protein kinase
METFQQVVVKQVNWTLSPEVTEQYENQLRQEEAVVRRVDHDGFPCFVDSFYDDEEWTLILSFIEGVSMKKAVLHRPAPGKQHHTEATIVNFGIAICTLLDYLHRLKPPIIHRDVKPGNIILTPERTCALIDFGIARQHRPTRFFWQAARFDTSAMGTPGYAPPEQHGIWRGNPPTVTPPTTTPLSDIYSVGAILYQMVTGYETGSQPMELRFKYPPLSRYVASGGISRELAYLIMQMLAYEPEHRTANDREVIKYLEFISQKRRRG